MPNRLRLRGPTKHRSRRTVRPLSVSILDLMPAIEQPGRHHVERLEILTHKVEDLLEVGEHTTGELVNQKRTIRMQHRMRFLENCLSNLRRHSGVGNPGEHVVGVLQPQRSERRIGIGGRPMHHMESIILDSASEEANEVRVGFQGDDHCVGAHPPEDLRRKGSDAGAVFQKNSSPAPVDFRQYLVDQETRTRDQAPEHAWMLDEIATK
jgi:hypothetical protein